MKSRFALSSDRNDAKCFLYSSDEPWASLVNLDDLTSKAVINSIIVEEGESEEEESWFEKAMKLCIWATKE